MSILNVNQIQPVGSGQTITISASDITASSATITASSVTANLTGNVTGNLTGNVTSSGISTFSSGVDITGGQLRIGTTSGDGTLRVFGDSGRVIIGDTSVNYYDADTHIFRNYAAAQKVTINSSGNIVLAGSGQGIDFSATSDGSGTMSSELLDDYEEGSWTPTLTDSSQANVYSSGTRYGYYTKVGRIVTATAVFDNATCVAGNNVKVGGLPYTITSTTTRYPGFNSHTTGAAISGTTIHGGYARPGETNFQLIQQNSFSTVNFSSGAFYMFLTVIYVV